MIEELVERLQTRLLKENNLATVVYYFLHDNELEISKIDFTDFVGEIESIAIESFQNEYVDRERIKQVEKKLSNNLYKRYVNVYSLVGLYLQDILNQSHCFEKQITEWFSNHSVKHKYLIAKVFNKLFEEKLIKHLEGTIESDDAFVLFLKYLYLEERPNVGRLILSFSNNEAELDIIDLLVLEDLQNIQAIKYNKVQEELFNDILWCATEIQSKHKMLNNNEDQYNSNFQSLLKAKGYKTEPQTQRGESSTGNQYGELDIAIFAKNNLPISIFEAFNIDSIQKEYITKHLVKLSEHYDPNGLKNNYAVIYAKNDHFDELWKRYISFVPTINFKYKIPKDKLDDIGHMYPIFAGIKLGVTKHRHNGVIVNVYHIFMNMHF